MYFFLLVGIYNSIVSVINFFKLFNENTLLEASAILQTSIILAVASFAIFSLLSRIKTLEKNVDALWKIAEEKGYQKPVESKPDIYVGNYNNKDFENNQYFGEKEAEEYFANLNINDKDGE